MQNEFYKIASRVDLLMTEYKAENLIEIERFFVYEGIYEYFIKMLTRGLKTDWFIPLKDKGYFDPAKNLAPQELKEKPGYYAIPYWEILTYLEVVAKKNGERPEEDVTHALVDIINEVTSYRDDSGKRIDNYRTDWIMLTVLCNIPTDYWTEAHIQFIHDSLKSAWGSTLVASDLGRLFIPRLIEDKKVKLLLQLIDVILDFKKKEDSLGQDYFSVMDEHWLLETLKKNKQGIAKLCGAFAARKAICKMKQILSEDESRFNFIWIPTIEDHPQISFPERYECQLVQFVRDMYEYSEPQEMRGDIIFLLVEHHAIFRRIAYHLINRHYSSLKELFWKSKENPLDVLTTHEIYELLMSHCNEFDDDEIAKLLKWIETEEYPVPEEIDKDPEKRARFIAKRKVEWLSAILDKGTKEIKAKYEYYRKIFGHDLDHPGFSYWSESGPVKDESPISIEDLATKSNREVVEYLKGFKDEGKFVWGKLSEMSLTNTFKKCVTDDPKKFSKNLEPFLEVPPIYIVRMLWGLAEVWRNNQDFEWNELLDFMQALIEPDVFWNQQCEETRENYMSSIIRAIADLIKEGTRSDDHAFNPDLLPKAKVLLLRLLDKTQSDLHASSDIVTAVLNSTKGHIYEALINYSLRHARHYKSTSEHRWDDEIKSEFSKRLDRQLENTPEFSVILGQYLANLIYLDKQWVTSNVDKIFVKDDQVHWQASMCGYLYYANRVYEVIYNLLKSSGDLEKALNTEFSDKFATERLIQHIGISFLEGAESLSDASGLLTKVLEKSNPDQLKHLSEFLWTFRDKLTKEQQNKIKQLWGKTMETVSEKLTDAEYRPLATNLAKWLSLVDTIDNDIFNWMKQIVQHLDKDQFNYFLVENLLRHVENAPQRVGEIYIEMLANGVYPLYQEEHIKELVRKLYAVMPDLADRICNMYGEKGHIEILEDVYRENHR